MPTSYVRLLVAGLTVALAVITGLVTGWFAAPATGCGDNSSGPASVATSGPAAPSRGQAPGTTQENGKVQPSNTPGGAVAPGPLGGNTNALTVGSATQAEAEGDCQFLNPETAIAGFFFALLTGGVAGGAALFLPRQGGGTASGRGGPPVWAGRPEPVYAGGRGSGTATGTHPVLSDAALGMPSAAPGSPITPAPEAKRLSKERRTLIETCIYVRDRATSKAIGDRLGWALNEVGVVEDRPTGEAFSTARHEAGGTAPTDDRNLEGTIAAVEISGYTDRGQVVRAPVVTVFRSDAR